MSYFEDVLAANKGGQGFLIGDSITVGGWVGGWVSRGTRACLPLAGFYLCWWATTATGVARMLSQPRAASTIHIYVTHTHMYVTHHQALAFTHKKASNYGMSPTSNPGADPIHLKAAMSSLACTHHAPVLLLLL